MTKHDNRQIADDDTDFANYPPIRRRTPAKKPRKNTEQDVYEDFIAMSYHPAVYEKQWLEQSLLEFYQQRYISDVNALVKGGKEANVYRCAPHTDVFTGWIAAKVYRPKMFRTLRNDAIYRKGRAVLNIDAQSIKENEERMAKALQKRTDFGRQIEQTSWLMYEYTTLQMLHTIGASVPRPIAVGANAILMEYIGDEYRGAPSLHETEIPEAEAPDLFGDIIRNIELLLQNNFVHGDLSAYNILYQPADGSRAKGAVTIIDFPQVVNIVGNPNAKKLFQRDVLRVCEYFSGYGLGENPELLAEELWQKYYFTEEIPLVEEFSGLDIADLDLEDEQPPHDTHGDS